MKFATALPDESLLALFADLQAARDDIDVQLDELRCVLVDRGLWEPAGEAAQAAAPITPVDKARQLLAGSPAPSVPCDPAHPGVPDYRWPRGPKRSSNAGRVLEILRDNYRPGLTFSVEQLARGLGWTTHDVEKALRRLRGSGLIEGGSIVGVSAADPKTLT